MSVELTVNGNVVVVADERLTLLDVLRGQCGLESVKDGCAPQGQCGCCTVLIDGVARVSCVTPVRRIAGRSVVTVEGLPEAERASWAEAFVATGGSQCGFCTPGIICRLSAVDEPSDAAKVDNALAAHLCRCTGWQTIVEAISVRGEKRTFDAVMAQRRATLEGGSPQRVATDVVLGNGGFSTDTAPADALIAMRSTSGEWVLGETMQEVRELAGKVQGRRTTVASAPPIAVPPGEWARTLRTSWVEPAHLETEASWCEPGGEPSSLLANGGAFGAKLEGELGAVAQRLSTESGRSVLAVYTREDSVRFGAKRPPLAIGMRRDGSGEVHVTRTEGVAASIKSVAPLLNVTEVDLVGPPTSANLRGAGWVEAAILLASVRDGPDIVERASGARAEAVVNPSGIHVTVNAGPVLDATTLRSYCVGAAHMAYSWVMSESIAVNPESGEVQDLTIRSFGIVRAADTPPIHITIRETGGDAVNGSDAVFAAVAAATWRHEKFVECWPVHSNQA